MTCPFCGGALIVERDANLGEGETGGHARSRVHRCASCAVALGETRVDKIGSADESWLVSSPPIAGSDRALVPPAPRAAPCERCGGIVIVAMPIGHVPPPAYAFDGMTARLRVSAETRCSGCGASGYFRPHG